MQPILSVKNLTIKINSSKVLDSVSFDVNRGDILAIIGPNGAGKTTLLKALIGLTQYEGQITWEKNLKIGYVPQRMEIETDLPLSVKEFFSLKPGGFDEKKITEVISAVQLKKEILSAGFGEVSVGQRQRLLVAWSLLDNPDILLFDEPTADVDVYGQESIYNLISGLNEKMKLTVVLISHDLNVVYKYANRVLCLNHKNICLGAPEDIFQTGKLTELYGADKGFYFHSH